ncbi:MAG: hypothetical protein MI702_10800, partial [Chlorobiales bacterium]|nr:hypothetical protein [Chlorobiales bacterium]
MEFNEITLSTISSVSVIPNPNNNFVFVVEPDGKIVYHPTLKEYIPNSFFEGYSIKETSSENELILYNRIFDEKGESFIS